MAGSCVRVCVCVCVWEVVEQGLNVLTGIENQRGRTRVMGIVSELALCGST